MVMKTMIDYTQKTSKYLVGVYTLYILVQVSDVIYLIKVPLPLTGNVGNYSSEGLQAVLFVNPL